MTRSTIAGLALTVLLGCQEQDKHDHKDHIPAKVTPPTNRLDVPQSVRKNLGITFVPAEERPVERMLRLPGRFELLSTATRVYSAPLGGVVEVSVKPLDRVVEGTVLARLRPPELPKRQGGIHTAEHAIGKAQEEVALARTELKATEKRLAFVKRRLKRLGRAEVRRADLDGQRVELAAQLHVRRAKLTAALAEVNREKHHAEVLLRGLAGVTGASLEELTAGTPPLWNTMTHITIRAKTAGIVSKVGIRSGGWSAQGGNIVEVADDRQLRFVATVLQGDLERLTSATHARVGRQEHPPEGGTVRMGVTGDALTRTYPLIVDFEQAPAWARAGLSGFAEVVVDGTPEPEIAIPRTAVVRDGLQDVFFVRDKANADQVIRVKAELGPDDGRWVVVYSGVNVGDQVVLDGAYELQLAMSVQPRVKGHFHADGSFHPDKEH